MTGAHINQNENKKKFGTISPMNSKLNGISWV